MESNLPRYNIMNKKEDIMSNILTGEGNGSETRSKSRISELDCLIYKNDSHIDDTSFENLPIDSPNDPPVEIWQASKENVSVKIWDGKAKIKVKVSSGQKKNITMKRIAKIAVDAILEELKKED